MIASPAQPQATERLTLSCRHRNRSDACLKAQGLCVSRERSTAAGPDRAAGATAGAHIAQRTWVLPPIDATIHPRTRPDRLGSFLDFYVFRAVVSAARGGGGVSGGSRASWGSTEKRHLHRVLFQDICIYYSTDFLIVNMHVRIQQCLPARGGRSTGVGLVVAGRLRSRTRRGADRAGSATQGQLDLIGTGCRPRLW